MRHSWAGGAGVVLNSSRTRETTYMRYNGFGGKFLIAGALVAAISACSSEQPVSFSQDVKPILDKNCLACHEQFRIKTVQ